MAISFSENKNRQKYLIIIFVVLVLASVLLFKKDDIFKTSNGSFFVTPIFSPPSIEINFTILQNKNLKEFVLPEPPVPFLGQAGRKNPFLSY
jgi:hypothetical protein